MSDSPCTGCRATNRGRLFFVYVNHYVGEEMQKRRVRLCNDCVIDLLVPLLETADYQEGKAWLPFDAHASTQTDTTAQRAASIATAKSATLTTFAQNKTTFRRSA